MKRAAAQKPRRSLTEYRRKRDFAITTEPGPGAKTRRHRALTFMVHKHDATRLHYDLRFEYRGVLLSWACPKGPSYDPADKRLAVQTEDHPLAYGGFEGRIPDGEYGAGDSLIWDRGTYDTVPPGQVEEQLKKGRLRVKLEGEKLQGEWHLVRTRMEAKKSMWLCIKAHDGKERSGFDVEAERPESVKSGKRVTRGPVRPRTLRAVHASPDALLSRVWPPMLAQLSEPGRTDDSYLYEVKYDGYRALAAISGGTVILKSRNQLLFNDRFPWAVSALEKLVVGEAVIDGELIHVDEKGVSHFQSLGGTGSGHRFVAFNLLWLEGEDLRNRPLEERRELLESVFANQKSPLLVSERIDGSEAAVMKVAKKRGLEGVIAKKRGSPYEGRRSASWLKLKTMGTEEFTLIGFTPISNGHKAIGALLLGSRVKGKSVFVGKVGTGFDTKTRSALFKLLSQDRIGQPSLADPPRVKGVVWVKPQHVAQISFIEKTADGKLRHPVFQGLREDKGPEEVGAASPGETVAITHPEKIIFPKSRFNKVDVRSYYDAVAPVLVPALDGRPLSFQQWPQGIAGPSFFRHEAATAPGWITRTTVHHEDHDVQHIVVNSPRTLSWLANQSALVLHVMASRVGHLDQADWVVFDFDPGPEDKGFVQVANLAVTLKGLLDQIGLKSYPKTSGQRGLHVHVPLAPGHTHAQVTSFATKVTETLATRFPDLATTERSKKNRHGRLYLDAFQNGHLKTVVAPYSIRAVEGAPVSTPLEWDEVSPDLNPRQFNIKTVPARIGRLGDLFAPVLKGNQRLPSRFT